MKSTTIWRKSDLTGTVRRTLQFIIMGCWLFLLSGCGILNNMVQEGIESSGSDLTGVDVDVAEADMRIFGGMGEITGVVVPNPPGYTADNAFELDLIRVNVGIISTLFGDTILLEELVIDGLRINFEQKKPGVSNLKGLMDTGSANADKKEPIEEEDKSSEKPVRISTDTLLIRDVQYSILLEDGRNWSGTLPTINLSEVGVPEGKTPAGLGLVLLATLGREIFLELAADKLRDRIGDLKLDLKMLAIDHIMLLVEEKVGLSREQLQQVRPVFLEKSQALKLVVEEIKNRGFLNLDTMPDKFKLIAAQTRSELAGQLTPEQLDKVDVLFHLLQQSSREKIMTALSSRMAQFLELHQGQILEGRAILRDEIDERSKLLAGLVHDPLLPSSDFMKELEAIQEKTRHRLEPLLDSDKMERLRTRQEQLRKLIEEAYFGIAAPLIRKLKGNNQ